MTSPEGDTLTRLPSRFYLNRNLACFSLYEEPSYRQLALYGKPPIRVDRVYWYWYFHK